MRIDPLSKAPVSPPVELPPHPPRATPRGLAAIRDSIGVHPHAALAVLAVQRDIADTSQFQINAMRETLLVTRQSLRTLQKEQSEVTDQATAATLRRTRWNKLATIGQFFSSGSLLATGLMIAGPLGWAIAGVGALTLVYHIARETGRIQVSSKVDTAITLASAAIGIGGTLYAIRAGALLVQGGIALVQRITSAANTSFRFGRSFAERDLQIASSRLILLRGAAKDAHTYLKELVDGAPELMRIAQKAIRVASQAIQLGAS